MDFLAVAGRPEFRLISLPLELPWLSGESPFPNECRLPRYAGDVDIDSKYLWSLACGKLARLDQMRLTDTAKEAALLNEMLIWKRHGYPAAVIKRFWIKGTSSSAMMCRRAHRRVLETW